MRHRETFINAMQNPVYVIIYMVFIIAIIYIALFIVYGMIHVFATKVQGGEGTLRGLIVRANLLTIGTYVIYAISAGLSNVYTALRVVERYEGVNIMESLETLDEYNRLYR